MHIPVSFSFSHHPFQAACFTVHLSSRLFCIPGSPPHMTGDNRQNREEEKKIAIREGKEGKGTGCNAAFFYFPMSFFMRELGRAYVRMWPGVSGLDPVSFSLYSFALPCASANCPVPLCAASAILLMIIPFPLWNSPSTSLHVICPFSHLASFSVAALCQWIVVAQENS